MAIRILFHSVKCQSFTKNVLIAFVFPRLKVKFLSTGFKVLYILAVLYLSNFLPVIMPSHLLYSHPDLFSISPTLQDLSFLRACALEVQDNRLLLDIQFSTHISPICKG